MHLGADAGAPSSQMAHRVRTKRSITFMGQPRHENGAAAYDIKQPRFGKVVGAGPNVLSFGRFQNADEIAAALA